MSSDRSRRAFLEWAAFSSGLVGLGALAGCGSAATPGASGDKPRLKAAFSNAGLKSTWCSHGMKTAQQWGEWLGIDVVVYDSQFNIDKQLADVEDMAAKDFDFVAIQPYGVRTLVEPVKRLIDKGVPVIDMDVRIVPEGEDIGLWTFITPDHEKLAVQATQALVDAIGGKGNVVHTQGALTHTGAQLRAKGFKSVIEKYPDIHVIDEQPGDWDINKTGKIWDDLLVKYPQIDGAFLHSDDMGMAAVRALKRSGQDRKIVFVSIDAQDMGINGVLDGDLLVSPMNPAGRIHWAALMVGYYAVALGQKKDEVPREIWIDSPVISKDNAKSYQYLMHNLMI